jgi:hypothetical protein
LKKWRIILSGKLNDVLPGKVWYNLHNSIEPPAQGSNIMSLRV